MNVLIDGATAKREELMEKPYTHTTWRVKAGSEDEFVRRWSEWVDWSHREGLEAPALLLRDLENPQAFISFGPWANMAAVRNWRASPATRNGWHGSARYSTASSHERSRSSHGARQVRATKSRCNPSLPRNIETLADK